MTWVQADLIAKPVSARRTHCRCGCGRWWYRRLGLVGRPVEYATPSCFYRARSRRRRAALKALEVHP